MAHGAGQTQLSVQTVKEEEEKVLYTTHTSVEAPKTKPRESGQKARGQPSHDVQHELTRPQFLLGCRPTAFVCSLFCREQIEAFWRKITCAVPCIQCRYLAFNQPRNLRGKRHWLPSCSPALPCRPADGLPPDNVLNK